MKIQHRTFPERHRDRAVILDRDGTINIEVGYLTQANDFRLIPGTPEAIKAFNNLGLRVVVVTNQAGIARGFLSETTLEAIHRSMGHTLRRHNASVDAVYYCPHHPTDGFGPYKVNCECRKPKPGMLKRAAAELDIDLSQSFIVGDKLTDLEAGRSVGCSMVLVRTGYGPESERNLEQCGVHPEHIAEDLLAASKWIVDKIKRSDNNT